MIKWHVRASTRVTGYARNGPFTARYGLFLFLHHGSRTRSTLCIHKHYVLACDFTGAALRRVWPLAGVPAAHCRPIPLAPLSYVCRFLRYNVRPPHDWFCLRCRGSQGISSVSRHLGSSRFISGHLRASQGISGHLERPRRVSWLPRGAVGPRGLALWSAAATRGACDDQRPGRAGVGATAPHARGSKSG